MVQLIEDGMVVKCDECTSGDGEANDAVGRWHGPYDVQGNYCPNWASCLECIAASDADGWYLQWDFVNEIREFERERKAEAMARLAS